MRDSVDLASRPRPSVEEVGEGPRPASGEEAAREDDQSRRSTTAQALTLLPRLASTLRAVPPSVVVPSLTFYLASIVRGGCGRVFARAGRTST